LRYKYATVSGMAKPRMIKPGTYALRAYVGRSATGSPMYLHETYVHDRPDAGVKEATARLRELEKKAAEMTSTTSFGALIDEWMKHSSTVGRRSPTTIAGYVRRVPVIKAALGAVPVGKLTPKMLDDWYNEMLEAGRTPADVKAFHRIVSAALHQGEKWGTANGAVARRASPITVPKYDVEPPSPDRVETLIRLAEESRSAEMADLIHWAAISGMRRGEICGLHWSRVDWDAARVYVCRSVWQSNQTIEEKDTKTHLNRWVPVGQAGIAILKTRQARALATAEGVGVTLDPDGYVWSTDEAGRTPMHPDRITQAFKRLCRKAEAPARKAAETAGRPLSKAEKWSYNFHDLRHYAITELMEGGLSLAGASKFAGHSLTSTTANIYAHGRDSSIEEAAVILGSSIRRTA
jgi:integrase